MALEIEKENLEEKRLNDISKKTQIHSHSHVDDDGIEFVFKTKIINMFLQNAGILLGFTCMLLLALYSKYLGV